MNALVFPASPNDGDFFDVFKYNGTLNVWDWDVVPGPRPFSVEYLVISGGGGGGAGQNGGRGGGGGGAGGMKTGNVYVQP